MMRFIALDVYRDFCEVAMAEDGRVLLAGASRRSWSRSSRSLKALLQTIRSC
jgi:hypothetical protein